MSIVFESEKFIEDYVCRRLEDDEYCVITEESCSLYERQVSLGSYGIADVIKISPEYDLNDDGDVFLINVEFTILELKNVILEEKHLSQVNRYAKGLQFFLDASPDKFPFTIRKQLAGLQNKQSDFVFLAECADIECYFISATMEKGFISESIGEGYQIHNHIIPQSLRLYSRTIEMLKADIPGILDGEVNE